MPFLGGVSVSPGLHMELLMHRRRRAAGEGRPSADVSPCRCSRLAVAFGKQLLGKCKPGAGVPPSLPPRHLASWGVWARGSGWHRVAVGAEAAELHSFKGNE